MQHTLRLTVLRWGCMNLCSIRCRMEITLWRGRHFTVMFVGYVFILKILEHSRSGVMEIVFNYITSLRNRNIFTEAGWRLCVYFLHYMCKKLEHSYNGAWKKAARSASLNKIMYTSTTFLLIHTGIPMCTQHQWLSLQCRPEDDRLMGWNM